ncbi:MAG: dienelactone hydrolase [Hyphomicrobiales bacterium]|nr:dienelactone hydrolase [Hyphomicrobiales bacterium]
MQEDVTFVSEGLKLSGVLTLPADYKAGERRPAVIVLHGFGSNKMSSNVKVPCDLLSRQGYVTLGFDMRGCGVSEGEKGRVICLEQVEDTKSAVTFLQGRPEIDPARIALLGSSFGAAVAVYTGSVDERVAAVVSSGGWGDGERKFRGQHRSPEEWAKFTGMLEEGKRHRERTGQSLMVPRYDIVPIPPELRGHVVPGSIHSFPAETAQSMFDFRADDVVARMAPRPLLLLHSSVDSVTPTEQSVELFKRAGQPTDLHLFAETDHFMFADTNTRVHSVLNDWLARYFPVHA